MGLLGLKEVGRDDRVSVGGKAAALGELMRAGFRVPDGFIVGPDAPLDEAILVRFRTLGSPRVAVRSSAAVEDGHAQSWAGQFETFLNVSEEDLFDTIRQCRLSGKSDRANAYGTTTLSIPVIIQAMVPADVAGVAFSHDPVTGERRVTIEAVRGLGDALVSGRVDADPEALVVSQSDEITSAVKRIESHFGHPIDVEWAIADGVLYVLQARPITAL